MIAAARSEARYSRGGTFLVAALIPVLVARAAEQKAPPSRPHEDPVSLHQFARSLGLTPSWITPDEELRLKSEWSDLVFTAPSREVDLSGVRVFLGDSVEPGRRTLSISTIDRDRLLLPIMAPHTLAPRPPVRVVALDAGHGGRDTGTRNPALKLLEKELTLDVVRRLQPLLEGRGFNVVLTRTDDTYVDLAERPASAARAQADVFVSVHFNSGPTHVHGVETYVLTPQFQRSTGSEKPDSADNLVVAGNDFDDWSANLGYTMHRQLISDLHRLDRGLKHARFEVLRELRCPGILIEGGFISHKEEARLVSDPAFRQRLAEAIARGLDAFNATLRRLEARRTAAK